jgi:hypothetical protein
MRAGEQLRQALSGLSRRMSIMRTSDFMPKFFPASRRYRAIAAKLC